MVTDPAAVTLNFQFGGATIPLGTDFVMVFVNRSLLRASEYTVSGNAVTFLVTLYAGDEIEVLTSG